MIDETIQRIEARLRNAEHLPEQTRTDLLTLVATLRAEVAQLPSGKADAAEKIARYTDRSMAEAVSTSPDAEQFQGTIGDLAASVREFEGTHPRLVQIVNNIANTLSGLGI